MVFTFSSCPISVMPSDLPLRPNVEVRAATLSVGIRESALRISSVIPSEKYSLSGLALMFANGRTPMDCNSVSRDRLAAIWLDWYPDRSDELEETFLAPLLNAVGGTV